MRSECPFKCLESIPSLSIKSWLAQNKARKLSQGPEYEHEAPSKQVVQQRLRMAAPTLRLHGGSFSAIANKSNLRNFSGSCSELGSDVTAKFIVCKLAETAILVARTMLTCLS